MPSSSFYCKYLGISHQTQVVNFFFLATKLKLANFSLLPQRGYIEFWSATYIALIPLLSVTENRSLTSTFHTCGRCPHLAVKAGRYSDQIWCSLAYLCRKHQVETLNMNVSSSYKPTKSLELYSFPSQQSIPCNQYSWNLQNCNTNTMLIPISPLNSIFVLILSSFDVSNIAKTELLTPLPSLVIWCRSVQTRRF